MRLLLVYRYVKGLQDVEWHADRSQFLFLEPNASDPLNKEAAEDLKQNREGFKRNVRASLGGGTVKGQNFDRVLK